MTTVKIQLEDQLKKDFDKFCTAVGMDMTTAFTVFAKTVVREQCIPFVISADPFYNSANMKRLKKAIADFEKH